VSGVCMPTEYFKCPQCGMRTSKRKIITNNYACTNPKCILNVRLLVHGEVTTTGKVSKLYGWVLEPGIVLKKKYEIIKMIGKGGFGATYLARDRSMFDQFRAIKEIPSEFCDEKEDEFLTFLSHPSIPKLYERFNSGKFHYSVMEFIEGESVEEKVKLRSNGLPEAQILKLAEQIFDVLSYIHSQNVIHRDLKPDNILIRKDGSISLIDFGIAKKFQTGFGTRHLARAASNFYSSPEQYRPGKGYTDYQSDIYSLGAIFYFISTGVEPPDALSRDPSKDIMPLPRSLNSQISKRLESVIVKAMKMKKDERFKTIQIMKKVLLDNGKTPSTKICSKCRATINVNDKYCRNCGSATQPLKSNPSSKFVFRSQKKATNIQQLVQICYQDWNEAVTHLYKGDFEEWLKTIKGSKALATKASAIRKNQRDRHLGLNEFLMSSGYGIPPTIAINPIRINLGRIPKGLRKRFTISTGNKGKGYLKGKIIVSVDWISSTQQYFACLNNMTTQLFFNVDTRNLESNKTYQTIIVINSNGGNVKIPISVFVTSRSIHPKSNYSSTDKSSLLISYFNPIFLFLFFAMMIRYLGPNASFSISRFWIIMMTGIMIGIVNIHYKGIGFIFGCLIGASLGAMLNIISYYVYALIDQNIVTPVLKYLTASYSEQMSYAGWGAIGIYLGGTYALFSRKARKNKHKTN